MFISSTIQSASDLSLHPELARQKFGDVIMFPPRHFSPITIRSYDPNPYIYLYLYIAFIF